MTPASSRRVSEADGLAARLRAAGCVFAEDEAAILRSAAADAAQLESWVTARAAGAPLEQLVGWVDFAGLRLAVGPGVFVPRQRTRLLAELACAAVRATGAPLVEVCCGAAPVAAYVARELPGARLFAVDVDSAAARYARRNAPSATVLVGDLYTPLPAPLRGRVGVLAANAPYVPTGELALMPGEARDHEPRVALDGGADGVDVQRRVIAGAGRWLRPGGRLLIETGAVQAALTVAAMRAAGLDAEVVADPDRAATVVVGVLDGQQG